MSDIANSHEPVNSKGEFSAAAGRRTETARRVRASDGARARSDDAPDNTKLLTITQAMEELNVCRGTIYKLIAEGRLRTVRISRGARRVSRQAISDFIRDAEASSGLSKSVA